MTLVDNHGRRINYLRLAVTDRCNLRCFYCMPEAGINYVKREDLMTYEELIRVIHLLADLGIEKLRVTGGEPFLRKDLLDFLEMVQHSPIKEVHITTNGTMTHDVIPRLKELGIKAVNLSLDSLDRERFQLITRRDVFEEVMRTFYRLLEYGMTTKINMVVMNGRNEQDIIPMARLAQEHPVDIRFIEEMPFNGSGSLPEQPWSHHRILSHLQAHFPNLTQLATSMSSTAAKYQPPGFSGHLGIIAASSRTFCAGCNRLRITPQGTLRTCLYGEGVFNIKSMIREGASDHQIRDLVLEAIGNRAKDGFEAERRRRDGIISESMSSIGG